MGRRSCYLPSRRAASLHLAAQRLGLPWHPGLLHCHRPVISSDVSFVAPSDHLCPRFLDSPGLHGLFTTLPGRCNRGLDSLIPANGRAVLSDRVHARFEYWHQQFTTLAASRPAETYPGVVRTALPGQTKQTRLVVGVGPISPGRQQSPEWSLEKVRS